MQENAILAAMPGDELATILRHSSRVHASEQHRFYRPGDRLQHVYFPRSGIVSIMMAAQDGRAIETALIGPEGLVGGEAILGVTEASTEAVALTRGEGILTSAALVLQLPAMAALIKETIVSMLFQARLNALCHAWHPIDARFCRWLLQASDALEDTTIGITQESCAHVLGVQRTSISMVAHALQESGSLRTRRGKVEIRDSARLKTIACECYTELKRHAQNRKAAFRPDHLEQRPDVAFRASARPGTATSAE